MLFQENKFLVGNNHSTTSFCLQALSVNSVDGKENSLQRASVVML